MPKQLFLEVEEVNIWHVGVGAHCLLSHGFIARLFTCYVSHTIHVTDSAAACLSLVWVWPLICFGVGV